MARIVDYHVVQRKKSIKWLVYVLLDIIALVIFTMLFIGHVSNKIALFPTVFADVACLMFICRGSCLFDDCEDNDCCEYIDSDDEYDSDEDHNMTIV
jgi:hypothetical protein